MFLCTPKFRVDASVLLLVSKEKLSLRIAITIYDSVADNCSTSGCPYGEGCHFLHYVPGGIAALGLMPLGVSVTPTAPTPTSGMRSVLGGFGPTSNTSLLASSTDPSVTIGGYKTRLCNKYSTPEGCRFGEKCHFAHGETDLRPSNVRSNCVDYSVLSVWPLLQVVDRRTPLL